MTYADPGASYFEERYRQVDFDMALLVIASGLYRLLARTMRGYADA